jgi:uridine kinase
LLVAKELERTIQTVYSFVTHNRTEDTITTHPRKVMIVEGILLANPELRDLFDVKIYVHADSDERLIRRMKEISQTGTQYGRSAKPISKYFETNAPAVHRAY